MLQSLLMLSQSSNAKDSDAGSLIKLHLNGSLVSLGDFDEILTDDSNYNVGFELHTDDKQFTTVDLGYTLSEDDIKIGAINKCVINDVDYFDTIGSLRATTSADSSDNKQFSKSIPAGFINLLGSIHYISANRTGPVKYVEKKEIPETHKIDPQGNNVINTIASYKGLIPARYS